MQLYWQGLLIYNEEVSISKDWYEILSKQDKERRYSFVLEVYKGAVIYNNSKYNLIKIISYNGLLVDEYGIILDGVDYIVKNNDFFIRLNIL